MEVKLHKKGGYGFVRYQHHQDAVRAIVATNTGGGGGGGG